MQQPEHNIIRNASTLSNILDFCTRRGLPSWRYFLTPPTTQLREAEEILQDIDAFLRNLSDEDKVKVDASIADVSTENASDAQTLMSIQQMLSNLDQAMQRRQQLSATWAAHPLMRFPWTDLSRSIRTLVMGCVGLRVAVKTSTARARERFPHGVPPVPGHTYASSHHSGSQGHSSSSHLGNQTHAAHATVGGDPTTINVHGYLPPYQSSSQVFNPYGYGQQQGFTTSPPPSYHAGFTMSPPPSYHGGSGSSVQSGSQGSFATNPSDIGRAL